MSTRFYFIITLVAVGVLTRHMPAYDGLMISLTAAFGMAIVSVLLDIRDKLTASDEVKKEEK